MDLGETLETIYFDYNQAHIREDSKTVLSRIAEIMSSQEGQNLEIEGHCDSRGSTEYNLHLGERRARSVRKYLVTQGVSPNLLQIISYGEERPIDLGETESAHQKNRRAELKKP
jgi:peptidoglycan-associated lipoprotein